MGCWIDARRAGEQLSNLFRQREQDFSSDATSNVAFHLQYVADISVITFRPKVSLITGLDELGGNSDAVV